MLSIHKTFEKNLETGKKTVTLYVADGVSVQKFGTNTKIQEFMESLHDQSIRVTAVNATDTTLLQMSSQGVKILYSYWHDLDIDKGLPPAEIALAVANAPDSVFREFIPRRDIAEMKHVLRLRNAILLCYNGALKALKQVGRDNGLVEDEDMAAGDDLNLVSAFKEIKMIKKSVVWEENGKTSLDTTVAKLATEIPECQIFNEIADINGSWILAASVVAASGGLDRFDSVAALWHYYGLHVVDGKAPKRAKGSPISWSPAGKQAAYLLGQVIIKGTAGSEEHPKTPNKWRKVYEDEREYERSVHLEKCEGCKHPDGHSTARAARKVVKEIFKQFYLRVHGQEYENNHFKMLGVAAD